MHLRCTSPLRVRWAATASFIDVRCKRCRGCLLLRQYSWICRAAHEQAFAQRTWFITLTFRPVERANVMRHASARDRAKDPQQRLVAASGTYVTKFFKRLRRAGFALRYIAVPELHRDGFPHWHGLVHDLRGDLLWKDLDASWSAGFSVCKLVKDAKAIRYVTKYLAKDTRGRVRASLRYGETEADRQIERAKAVSAPAPPGEGSKIKPKV